MEAVEGGTMSRLSTFGLAAEIVATEEIKAPMGGLLSVRELHSASPD